ncbi:MAG: type II toxin-antitoxin system VapC family toxin [Acidobacteria bacterium]|nr:type II toxin-antitoxin system VapC family toxin [Acidobacteriota bacterium]
MNWLLDSNILVRMAYRNDPDRAVADKAVSELIVQKRNIYIVPQNLYELWTVITRPVTSNGYGFSTEEAEKEIDKLKSQFELKPDDETIYDNWEKLVRDYKVSGKATHDARLVAAMQTHGIDNILTFNIADFNRYSDMINASEPQDIVDQAAGSELTE